ncbi:hypothetical protein VTI74DRAFT_6934 [Chaetomium olivicolor]
MVLLPGLSTVWPLKAESLSHWALFLPDEDGIAEGSLVHVGVEMGSSGIKRNHKWRSRHPHYIIQALAEDIFNSRGYNVVTNNCQHFCFDMVAELHRRYPDLIPQEAVGDVAAHGTTITNVTKFLRS